MKVHKILATWFLVLTLASLVAGCAPLSRALGEIDPGAGAGEVELDGTKWDLIELNGTPVTGTGPATLDFDEERAAGTAFCNSFFATVERDGESLSFSEVGSTLMMCVEDVGPEAEYLAALQNVASYRVTGGNLQLLDATGDVILAYEPAETTALEGTTWVLSGYLVNQGISSTIAGADATAVIQDGSIGGTTGCNSYSAELTLDGSAVDIGEIVQTEMYCETPEGVMDQERTYLETLSQVESYEIVRDTLTFHNAAGDLLLTYVASAE